MDTRKIHEGDNYSRLEEVFQRVEIWPIKIFLPLHVGYILWGRNSLSDDVILSTRGDQIILFKSLSAVFSFVKEHHNQREAEIFIGYNTLKEFTTSKEFYRLRLSQVNCDEFDFVNVQCTLCENYHSISNLRQCSYLLNCLNLLYDVGITLNSQVILSKTKRGGSELADLMDSLTFLRQEELSATLAQFDFRKICLLYGRLLKVFENNLVLF